jgi:UDPglucose--hexose-1-phosphate uridylyltransferase
MSFHAHRLHKPDGRELVLYARQPFDVPDPTLVAATPLRGPRGSSHLRWHPLRGEWVLYANHRQERTFLPPDWNPLAPTSDPQRPSEVPAGAWEVAVFENLFSALGDGGQVAPQLVPTAPAAGRCEVVVFTQDPAGSLGGLSVEHLALVLEVWADRSRALGDEPGVAQVFPFENRGVAVGVTLAHPHGQIYAYPFVPPIIARSLELQRAYHALQGHGLLETMIAQEVGANLRTLHVGEHAVAFVPACARWAYEIWVAPRRCVPTLAALTDDERLDLARALRLALRKLDALWQAPMPYILAVHQAPAQGEHGYAHVHIEIYPWLRMPGRPKYLAGSEVGAGAFTADTLPEAKAAELRAVHVGADAP